MATFDTSSIDPLANDANQAATTATNAASSALTLPDMIKSALTEKFNTNNPLISQRDSAFNNYLTAGTQNKYAPQNQGGVIFSPTQIRAFEAKDQANALTPLSSLTDLVNSGYGGIGNIVDSSSRAFTAQANQLQGVATSKRQSYLDALDALKFQTQVQQQNEQLAEQKRQFDLTPHGPAGGAAGVSAANMAALKNDVASGKVLKDVLAKYAGLLDPNDILTVYNSASRYGPAKEGADLLQQYGIKSMDTADTRNRVAALKPAVAAINSVDLSKISKLGPQNKSATLQLSVLGGLGVDKDIVKMNQTFALLKQNVVRALQGAKMSDTDIKLAQDYVPAVTDTPEVVRSKLAGLQNFINSLGGSTSTTNTGGGSWEVIQ